MRGGNEAANLLLTCQPMDAWDLVCTSRTLCGW